MDVKKSQQSTSPSYSPSRVKDFVGEVKEEIQRITWTNKEELQSYTKIVVIATFLFGLGIFSIDLIIRTALDGLGQLIRFVAG